MFEKSNLNSVIEEVKNYKSDAWIWENVNERKLKEGVLLIDTLDILEQLREFEVELTQEEFDEIMDEGDGDNTYNWGNHLTNDLALNYVDKENGKCLVAVHLGGDVRGNYTDCFAVENFSSLFSLEYDSKGLNFIANGTKCHADVTALAQYIEVYKEDGDRYIGDFYENELEDLTKHVANELIKDMLDAADDNLDTHAECVITNKDGDTAEVVIKIIETEDTAEDEEDNNTFYYAEDWDEMKKHLGTDEEWNITQIKRTW